MIGTLVNAGAIIVGGSLGCLLKTGMPERIRLIYFQAVGIFTIALGVSMVYDIQHILIVVVSLTLGALLGEWWNIEKGIERVSGFLKLRLKIGSDRFSEGLITTFLLSCTGSMTILGAIQEGTGVSSDLLLTKSLMDGFSSLILASAFGVGVIVSVVPLLIFQGGITLLTMGSATFFTPEIIQGLVNVGGILMIGLGINILDIKKLRIMNMLPSLILVVILLWVNAWW